MAGVMIMLEFFIFQSKHIQSLDLKIKSRELERKELSCSFPKNFICGSLGGNLYWECRGIKGVSLILPAETYVGIPVFIL